MKTQRQFQPRANPVAAKPNKNEMHDDKRGCQLKGAKGELRMIGPGIVEVDSTKDTSRSGGYRVGYKSK